VGVGKAGKAGEVYRVGVNEVAWDTVVEENYGRSAADSGGRRERLVRLAHFF